MKSLKQIVSKTLGSDVKTELLCDSIEKWIINELAPVIQGWIIKELSPQIEKWVRDYVIDNHTALHIEDFCGDDSVDDEETHIELSEESEPATSSQGKFTKEEKKIVRKALELAYQVIKKEAETSKDFECFGETLVDNYIEWDNGYSNYLLNKIEELWK